MTTQRLNVRIDDNLLTSETFWNKIIHITFSEQSKVAQKASFSRSPLPTIGETILLMITIFAHAPLAQFTEKMFRMPVSIQRRDHHLKQSRSIESQREEREALTSTIA